MGRAQGARQTVGAGVSRRGLSSLPKEAKVLDALKAEGMAPPSYLRGPAQMTTKAILHVLEGLEERGAVTRVFNAFGSQIPWWWQTAQACPPDFKEPLIERGQIWDWGAPSERLWVEVKTGRNEFGLPRVMVCAGENNQFDTVIPAHYFGRTLHLRQRDTVSEWSSHFHCPVHGECTVSMVRTDKMCALCGSGLLRL